MILIENKNIWDNINEIDFLVFTGNSYIKKDSCLVMGRGMALEVKNKFPGIDRIAGISILDITQFEGVNSNTDEGFFYGFKSLGKFNYKNKYLDIGIFQVKYHFKDNADLELIRKSTSKLNQFIQYFNNLTIDMNFPGIGFGRLEYDKVYEIIKELPDSVRIWKKG